MGKWIKFSEDELDYIIKNSTRLTPFEMGAALGRAEKSIRQKLYKLGLPIKNKKPRSAEEAAGTSKVCRNCIYSAMVGGNSSRLLCRIYRRICQSTKDMSGCCYFIWAVLQERGTRQDY